MMTEEELDAVKTLSDNVVMALETFEEIISTLPPESAEIAKASIEKHLRSMAQLEAQLLKALFGCLDAVSSQALLFSTTKTND
jgi:hypothetical protein